MSKKQTKKAIAITLLKLTTLLGLLIASTYVPGQSQLQIDDYLISLSSGTLIAGLIITFVLIHWLLQVIRWLHLLPKMLQEVLAKNRHQRLQSLTLETLTALAAGETALAVDLAEKALKLADDNGLISILFAQALYQDGKIIQAEEVYTKLRKFDNTRFLSFWGVIQARRQQKRYEDILPLLQQALVVRPTSQWVLKQLFENNVRQREFEKAELVIEQLQIMGGLTKAQSYRSKAVLLWVKAEAALKNNDYDDFYEACTQAIKLSPDLLSAAFTLSKYYQESNRFNKGWKVLVTAYQANPNPAFLEAIERVLPQRSPIEIYQQAEELVSSHPHHPASLMILSHFAISTRLWGEARLHLNLLQQKQPTQSYYRLMAQLEQSEYPNKANKAEHYLKEAANASQDSTWVCQSCHHLSKTWSAFCPHCNGFDTLQWI